LVKSSRNSGSMSRTAPDAISVVPLLMGVSVARHA
jgi:hypothetical protein